MAPTATRHERFRAWLAERGLPGAVLLGYGHGVHLGGYSRYMYMPSAVLVRAGGEVELLVFFDEARAARELSSADEVSTYGEHGFGLDRDPAATLVAAAASRRRERFGRAPVAFVSELGDLSAAFGETVDCGEALAEIRLVKDADERRLVERAFVLALVGQRAVRDALADGVTEIELFSVAHHAAQVAYGEPIEFAADLLVGSRSAEVCWPVAVAGRAGVQPGDVVIADVAVRAAGYWGDTARTYVNGERADVAEGLAALREILDEAARLLVPGATGHEIHAHVAAALAERFPDGEFPHHAGHGVGLGGFEDPHLVPEDRRPLEEGMLIAVEPGIYFAGSHGLRLENVYAVAPGGGVPIAADALEASPGAAAGRPFRS
jgi:Xaa-Pro aminopeptidase